MQLTREQIEAVLRCEAVPLTIDGQACVLVRKDVYDGEEPEYDTGPWTKEEIDLLADEADQIISEGEEAYERQARRSV